MNASPARTLWFVAFAALASGTLYFLLFPSNSYPDTPSYIGPAENLLAGKGFTGSDFALAGINVDSNGVPETLRTPGYPLLIALFLWAHVGLKGLIVFQHLLRVLIIVGTVAFTFKANRSRQVALLTGILLVIDLPLLEAANALLTEMLFTAVVATVCWFLWEEAQTSDTPGLRLLGAGLLAGASVLVRPITLLFFAPACLFLLLTRPRLKVWAVLVFACGFACLPVGWAGRNQRAIGRFTVTTISGFSALQFKAAGSLAGERPGKFQPNFEAAQKELEACACREIEHLLARACSQITPAERSDNYSRLARQIVWQHPYGFLRSSLHGAAVLMLDGGATTLKVVLKTSGPAAMHLSIFYTMPIFLLFLWGLGRLWKIDRTLFWLAACVLGYFVLLSAGPESDARFRAPMVPLYVLIAAEGSNSLRKKTALGSFPASNPIGS
jgi:hypothetical protein